MFWERLVELCTKRGIKPSRLATELGFSKGSISYWKRNYQAGKDSKPAPDLANEIADYFHVDIDYLLGYSDDPTDYEDGDRLADAAGPQFDALGRDLDKMDSFQKAVFEDVMLEREIERRTPEIIKQYNKLDEIDRIKVESFIAGLLAGDKYKRENNANLASS